MITFESKTTLNKSITFFGAILFASSIITSCGTDVKDIKLSDLSSEIQAVVENKYFDMTSSEEDIEFYQLVAKPRAYLDGIGISFSLPGELNLAEATNIENSIVRYEDFLSQSNDLNGIRGYSFAVDFLESRNSQKLSDKEICDIMTEHHNDLSQLEAFFPKSVFSDLTVVSADFNLLINGKHFLRRIAMFTDNRLDGTFLEGVNITEFHYATYHKGKKYEFYLCYFGSDKAVGSLSAYFNTIAGTIKFSEK